MKHLCYFLLFGTKNGEKIYDNIITVDVDSVGTYLKDISSIGESGTEVTVTALYIGNNKLNCDFAQSIIIDGSEQTIEYSIDYAGYVYSNSYLEIEKSVK